MWNPGARATSHLISAPIATFEIVVVPVTVKGPENVCLLALAPQPAIVTATTSNTRAGIAFTGWSSQENSGSFP